MTHLTPDLVRAADDARAALDRTLVQFTRPSWWVYPSESEDDFDIATIATDGDDRWDIATVHGGLKETLANARLMAASVELVEALLVARAWLAGGRGAERVLTIIDEALAKAGVLPP